MQAARVMSPVNTERSSAQAEYAPSHRDPAVPFSDNRRNESPESFIVGMFCLKASAPASVFAWGAQESSKSRVQSYNAWWRCYMLGRSPSASGSVQTCWVALMACVAQAQRDGKFGRTKATGLCEHTAGQ